MSFGISANDETFHFKADGFTSFINFQNAQRQFSQDIEIKSRLLFKGTIIILSEGNVQMPMIAFDHPMSANSASNIINIQRKAADKIPYF